MIKSSSFINPPFESSDNDSYYDSLEKRLSSYIRYLRNSIFNERLDKEDFTEFISIKKDIMQVLNFYLSGQSGEAYKKLEEVLNNISNDWAKFGYSLDKENAFIRIRSTKERLNKRTDMFHVPFDKRHVITKQRYSIEGFPCLYLAGCAYTAWLELDMPEFGTIWASSFRPIKKMKVLDLSYTLNYLENKINEFNTCDLKYLLRLYFIVIATSFRVKYPQASFHEEYIISGLLLQWIKINSSFDGLRYLSTKLEYYDSNMFWCASNIVIPPKDYKNKEKYDTFLKKSFVLTLPQHWYVLMAYMNAGDVAAMGIEFKETTPFPDPSKTNDIIPALDQAIMNNYEVTWFYNIDGHLNSRFQLDHIEKDL